jgi:tetratricopeptide (TPR) repeat protein
MACKESMVTAPVLVVLFDRLFVFASIKEAFRRRGAFYAALAATWILLVVLNWSGPRIHSAGFGTDVHPWTYLLNQAVMIVRYVRLSVWPLDLVINYGWPRQVTVADVWPYGLAVGLVFLATVAAATVAALKYAPRIAFLGAWFFITLSPTSSIVPIATEVGAERRMYLPLLALTTLAALAVVAVWDRRVSRRDEAASRPRERVAGIAVTVIVGVALAAGTIYRNREYATSLRLAETTIERWPSPVAHHVLAIALLQAGRTDDAFAQLQQAIPEAPRAYYTRGEALYSLGRLDEAVVELNEFIRRLPLQAEVPDAHILISRACAKEGRWDEAIVHGREAVRKARRNPAAHRALADALFGKEMLPDAIAAYRTYLTLQPNDGAALSNLGIALIASGQHEAAIGVFRRGVEIDPNNGAGRRNLATALYDSGKLDDAGRELRAAIALRPADPFLHTLLGQTLARQGHFDEARMEIERALQIDPSDTDARDSLVKLRAAVGR